jgi:CTP synthase
LSVYEAIKHAGYFYDRDVNIKFIDASEIKENTVDEILKDIQGIIVPGGFGERGIKGKIQAIKYAREKQIPFLGLCLGMQLAVIEFARNIAGLTQASSTEFNQETKENVFDYLPNQYAGINLGGTMRLGLYDCEIKKDSLAHQLYQTTFIRERHRHRYEFNNQFKKVLEEAGMIFSGINPQTGLVEIIEIKEHPYFIACQFHPEFLSRPDKPHPLFKGLIKSIG